LKKTVILIMAVALLLLSGCQANQAAEKHIGTVTVTVIDGMSGLPIENVKVVIPECDTVAVTDSDGKTDIMRVELEDSAVYNKQGGLFTLLAFNEQYNDYVLYYANLDNNENRKMKIFLFRKDTPMSNGAPLATVECPSKDVTAEIVNKYR